MRVLLFDIDGTLIDAAGAGRTALAAALRSAFQVTDPVCELHFSGRTDADLWRELLAANEIHPSSERLAILTEHYLRHLPAKLGECGGRLLPGIEALLAQLVDRSGLLLGCLTGNLRASAQMKLNHFGLWERYFGAEHLFGGDEHRHRNELAIHARGRLRQRLGERHEVWIIGDTPRDVECARIMGARVLACSTGEYGYDELLACEPDGVVYDLSETEAIVERLLQ